MESSKIQTGFVSSIIYNGLPTILDVENAPEYYEQSLKDLRNLLAKHDVPKGINVRLLHKHSDTEDNEVMVFSKVPVPQYENAIIMKPVLPKHDDCGRLQGIHYFVTEDGNLQAYEYGEDYSIPDMATLQPFVSEFCNLVLEKGLQRIFGLKLQDEKDQVLNINYTEFELPAKRGTIMFPEGMPMPADDDNGVTVITEWHPLQSLSSSCKKHSDSKCSNHPRKRMEKSIQDMNDEYFFLGGQIIVPETELYQVVQRIITAF